jgi:hypothetical protein
MTRTTCSAPTTTSGRGDARLTAVWIDMAPVGLATPEPDVDQPAVTGAGFSIGTPMRLPYSVHEPS